MIGFKNFCFVALIVGAFLVSGVGSNGQAASNKDGVAVIIGNKNYSERVPEVSYAHRDADAMKRYVIDVLGYDEINIIDLRDATKAQLESAFGNRVSHKGQVWQYIDPKGESDITVFYSGHGVPGLDGRGYLLPSNANPQTAEINGYPIDLLYENLSKLKAKQITVYLDACFSGDSGGGMLIKSASPVYVKAQAPESISENMIVLTAATGTQLASWDENNRHGLFTHHLLDALYGKADSNADGGVTAFEVKDYLDNTMTRAARRSYRREQDAGFVGDEHVLLGVSSNGQFALRPILDESPPMPHLDVEEIDLTLMALKSANIREAPTTSAAKVGKLEKGQEVDVTGQLDGWYRISTRENKEAYVFGSLLGETEVNSTQVSSLGNNEDFVTSPRVGDSFQDCDFCPKMVVIPSGSFQMGSQDGEDDEVPVRQLTVEQSFAVGKYEVTREEFASFVRQTNYVAGNKCYIYSDGFDEKEGYNWKNPGFNQSDMDPVVCINWYDAKAYVNWLRSETGEDYRLLTEAEWEFAARAQSSTHYYFGNSSAQLCQYGNGSATETTHSWKNKDCSDGYAYTSPVGSFRPNAFGLYDMSGNAFEWVEDCVISDYYSDGKNLDAQLGGNCAQRRMRGGSWGNDILYLKSSRRGKDAAHGRWSAYGFRIARNL